MWPRAAARSSRRRAASLRHDSFSPCSLIHDWHAAKPYYVLSVHLSVFGFKIRARCAFLRVLRVLTFKFYPRARFPRVYYYLRVAVHLYHSAPGSGQTANETAIASVSGLAVSAAASLTLHLSTSLPAQTTFEYRSMKNTPLHSVPAHRPHAICCAPPYHSRPHPQRAHGWRPHVPRTTRHPAPCPLRLRRGLHVPLRTGRLAARGPRTDLE